MARCKGCGGEFVPRRGYHRYCDVCWVERQGAAAEPRRGPDAPLRVPIHPRLRWLREDWYWVCLLIVMGVAIVGLALGWW